MSFENSYGPYTRPAEPSGSLALPTRGAPALTDQISADLPGKSFRCRCSGTTLYIDFAEPLTGAEETTLASSVAAWVPTDDRVLGIGHLMPSPDVDVRTVDYKSGLLDRLHKVTTTRFRGEVRQVDYYLDATLADKVITVSVWADSGLSTSGYSRETNGLAKERWTERKWWNTDGSVAASKVTHKKYDHDPVEQMREGRRRRLNVIQALTLEVLEMLVVTTAVDPLNPTAQEVSAAESDGNAFLEAYDKEIGTYTQTGFLEWTTPPYTPNVTDDTTAWLDTTFDGSATIIAIAASKGWTVDIRSEILSHLVEINA